MLIGKPIIYKQAYEGEKHELIFTGSSNNIPKASYNKLLCQAREA